MQVDEIDDGGWTIFNSADAAPSRAAQSRLDLSVLKEIKNFLTSDAPSDDVSFWGDETLVDSNEVRVAYPFYDGTPVVESEAAAPETLENAPELSLPPESAVEQTNENP